MHQHRSIASMPQHHRTTSIPGHPMPTLIILRKVTPDTILLTSKEVIIATTERPQAIIPTRLAEQTPT